MSFTSQYNNSLTNANSIYNTLQDYHKKTRFGPPIPGYVPSMGTPTLPKEEINKYGYDVLNHGIYEAGYWGIDTAYGNSCTQFNRASCPSNRPVLSPSVEGFSQSAHDRLKDQAQQIIQRLKDLDIHIFVSDSCGFCKKLKEFLQQQGVIGMVTLRNTADPQNQQLFQKLGGRGVPFFYSAKTQKTFAGFVPDLNVVVERLSVPISKEGYEDGSHMKLQNLGVVIYGSDSCHYCKKLLNLLHKGGVLDKVTYKNVKDPGVMQELSALKGTGLPFVVSQKTHKTLTGLPSSVEDLIQKLQ
jgi:glutaredoxin